MAKFTVFFKDKVISSSLFDSGVVHIGRDETNTIQLDSLAVAPAHAAVIIRETGDIIKQLNDEFPLIINNAKVKEAVLKNNDKILLGKHTLIFNTSESAQATISLPDSDVELLNQEIQNDIQLPEANLQIIDGKHIGRVLPLKKAMTRLGRNGNGVIVIARRKEGYFVSALETNNSLKLNKQILGDQSLKLNTLDVIEIENTSLQFFQVS
ncbi:MAG: FHA domain-containing protein [Methylicorpusculum sp.]|uniref:FHA domain-containing protein n=1 Tax=Methylicorpusculum sp. TaxID=2713644 RepID=UPI002726DD66|nr:FHA domain-containing protein [Methylicorpusculum sp.]MDO8844892.1 FHA domain-containing protein [Methylicorpusculum sp.]MDO8938058.1 FHA domain-containing protein [Methylicorpusculum sp.]MDO9239306.1 FHA domain-containing protein [Methylicorpusculum sp.]MDP2180579.1 FHA domain-containing protein [Methylicorpusculum sp.]MDP2202167.1 FHA domain-containing protein [Methylicorpusculum sp.]